MKRLPALFIFILWLFFGFSCTADKPSMYKKSKALMDTFVTITVVAETPEKADKAIESAFSAISRFSNLIDFFSETSEITVINNNAGIRPVKVSSQTLDLIEKAIEAAEKSHGAFDPTIGPVIQLWDFHKGIKPPDNEIRRKLPLVDYRNIIVDRNASTAFLVKKGMMIDLGGIAKGYAADLASEELRQNGISSGLVAIAGDIRAFGTKPDGMPWKIGVKNPRQTNEKDEIIARLSLTDSAVSTSGDYERYFMQDNKRYHHLLNPKTGYPENNFRSVSIITGKGVHTDSYATAVFILGPEKGMHFIEQSGIDALIIDNSGRIITTQGIKGKVQLEENN